MTMPISSFSAYYARKAPVAQEPALDISSHANVQQMLSQLREEQSSMQNMLGNSSGGYGGWEEGRPGQIGFA
jgi:hypothetical protein